MLSKENWIARKSRPYIGHRISCVYYGNADDPADICVEGEDCNKVLVSAEDFNPESSEQPMTDRELMQFRFSKKNIHKSTGVLAQQIGMSRKEFELAVERGMENEQSEPCASCIYDEPGYTSVIGTCDHLCQRHWHCKPGSDRLDYKPKRKEKSNET